MKVNFFHAGLAGGGGISSHLLEKNLLLHNVEITSKKPDLIHGYGNPTIPIVASLAKKTGIPSVVTLNGVIYSKSLGNYTPINKVPKYIRNQYMLQKMNRYIDCFTTLCNYYRNQWINDGLIKPVTIIPNMIDSEFNAPRKKNKPSNIPFLYVGEKSYWRDLETLKKAYTVIKITDTSRQPN